ncbi:MAG: hypothetical protein ACFE68_09780 [Candidatus Hodarchaeota archaeon]
MLKKALEERYFEVLEEAKEYEQRVKNGKRWGGNTVLIIVDSALDSIGLNYFKIVVPRVKRFNELYVKTKEIDSIEKFSKLSPKDSRLLNIMNNKRLWNAAINISKVLNNIKKEKGYRNEFEALKYWAEKADYENWKEDPMGRIKGVGLITFQYLRMQACVDTTMPDKIIKRVMEQDFGIKAKNDIQFIKEMEKISKETGYSQTFLCWAIWLKYSDAPKTKQLNLL